MLTTLSPVHKTPSGLTITTFNLYVMSIPKQETSSKPSASQLTSSAVYGRNRNESHRENRFLRTRSSLRHSWFIPVRHCIFQLSGLKRELSDFFFSSRRRHTRCSRDWSSDVCSSD